MAGGSIAGSLIGGGSTTVTQKAGSLEKIQAGAAKQIAPELINYIRGGMKGVPSGQQIWGSQMAMNQMKKQAGSMGIQPGDPRLNETYRMLGENLTKPNQSVLDMAMALYTGAPVTGGTQTQTTTPGFGDYMGMGLQGYQTYQLMNLLNMMSSKPTA